MRTRVDRCDELHVGFMNRRGWVEWTAGFDIQVFETGNFSVADEPEVPAAFVTCITLRCQSRVGTLYNSRNARRGRTMWIAAYSGRLQELARNLHLFAYGHGCQL